MSRGGLTSSIVSRRNWQCVRDCTVQCSLRNRHYRLPSQRLAIRTLSVKSHTTAGHLCGHLREAAQLPTFLQPHLPPRPHPAPPPHLSKTIANSAQTSAAARGRVITESAPRSARTSAPFLAVDVPAVTTGGRVGPSIVRRESPLASRAVITPRGGRSGASSCPRNDDRAAPARGRAAGRGGVSSGLWYARVQFCGGRTARGRVPLSHAGSRS